MSGEKPKTYKASCLCAGVKFTLEGDPFHFVVCHCQNCKKASGSAFVTNALFQSSKVTITEGQDLISNYKDGNTLSGNTITRCFCSKCGSSLFVKPAKEGITITHPGLVDEPTVDWIPTKEFHKNDQFAWVKELVFNTKKAQKLCVASPRKEPRRQQGFLEGAVEGGSEDLALEEHGDLKDQLKVLLRDMAQPVAVVTSFMPHRHHHPHSSTSQHGRYESPKHRFHGATLSSFSSIAMDPYPLITFSLRLPSRMATTLSTLPANFPAHMVVNLLSSSQSSTAIAFSRPDLHPAPFDTAGIEYKFSEEGLPVLQGGVGALSCRLVGRGLPLHDLDHLAVAVYCESSEGGGGGGVGTDDAFGIPPAKLY
ncbi:hypothetical protein NLJ89_g9003 [Agrocybe chaxingu]|uniref:CENP-V/GFA domain-containing protein n=1 Tax=Agrocybe chaxingu TaxID=84603 RepID=A0A9W8JU85_9AGAR|nr:hypothetical protein NLJ89_g9003 [Agrocybe chaxingu]